MASPGCGSADSLSPKTAKSDPNVVWWLYLILCEHEYIYVGISPDPIRRFRVHCRLRSSHMRMNRPMALAGAIPIGNYRLAAAAERRVKRLTHAQKLVLAHTLHESREWKRFAVHAYSALRREAPSPPDRP